MAEPKITVIMPVFNGEHYLTEAIDSILAQTFSDLEFLIVDDGSTDATPDILAQYVADDRRVRVLRNEANCGIVDSLNRGLDEARASLIARMDADDISLPERLERQYLFLNQHPDVGLLGTWAQIWREGQKTSRRHSPSLTDIRLRFELLFNNPFVHSSIMMRKKVAVAVGGYRFEQPPYPEDYDLWSRMARITKMANIPEPLQIYRETESSVCRKNNYRMIREKVSDIAAHNVLILLKDNSSENEVRFLVSLLNGIEPSEERVSLFSISRLLWKICWVYGKGHELTVADRVWLWKRTFKNLARAYKRLFFAK
jgi:glycosyltransferase involved in cell wall biosynthesis